MVVVMGAISHLKKPSFCAARSALLADERIFVLAPGG